MISTLLNEAERERKEKERINICDVIDGEEREKQRKGENNTRQEAP